MRKNHIIHQKQIDAHDAMLKYEITKYNSRISTTPTSMNRKPPSAILPLILIKSSTGNHPVLIGLLSVLR